MRTKIVYRCLIFFLGALFIGAQTSLALAQSVTPRAAGSETSPPGRVLQANQSCMRATLTVNPNPVPDKNANIKFHAEVSNFCGVSQSTSTRLLYGSDKLVTTLTSGIFSDTLKNGETKTYDTTINAAGLTEVTPTTNFYVVLIGSGGAIIGKSEPIAVSVPYATNTTTNSNCIVSTFTVEPSSIASKDATLTFRLKARNTCATGFTAVPAIYYNKDIVVTGYSGQYLLPGGAEKDFEDKVWQVSGLQNLTNPTSFYVVFRYTQPSDSSQKLEKSNVVSIPVTIANTPPGDNQTGDGSTVAPPVTSSEGGTGILGCITTGTSALCVINFFLQGILTAFTAGLQVAVLWIVGPLIVTILSVRTYTDNFAEVIYPAWEVLRNLGNITFILAIVAIGIATVFRISGWAVKDLLVKLIIGALLINFSLTIAQSVLGVADTLQDQFLSTRSGAVQRIAEPLFTYKFGELLSASQFGSFTGTIKVFISLLVAFAAFMAFVGLAGLLLVRLVVLWLLLLSSPLPYVAMVLPVTRKYTALWWGKFFKWAFMTPILAFLLTLTATVVDKYNNVLQDLTQGTIDPASVNAAQSSTMFGAARALVPMAFMYMILKVASGVVGGSGVGFVDTAFKKVSRAAMLPATAIGAGAAAVGAGALKAGKATVMAPVNLAGKGIKAGVDTVKDSAKLFGVEQQSKLVSSLMPKAGQTGLGAGLGAFAANIASGGQLSSARAAKRKDNIEYFQGKVTAQAKDARAIRAGEAPRYVAEFEAQQLAKAQKEKADFLKAGTTTPKANIAETVDTLNSKATSFAKTVQATEATMHALENGYYDLKGPAGLKNSVVLEWLRSQLSAATDEAEKKKLTERINRISNGDDMAKQEEYLGALAAAGVAQKDLISLQNRVNAKANADGRYDNHVYTGPDLQMIGADAVNEADGKPRKTFTDKELDVTTDKKYARIDKRGAEDLAGTMHADLFADPESAAHFAYRYDQSSENGKNRAFDKLSAEKLDNLAKIFEDSVKEQRLRNELARVHQASIERKLVAAEMKTKADAGETITRDEAKANVAAEVKKQSLAQANEAIEGMRNKFSI